VVKEKEKDSLNLGESEGTTRKKNVRQNSPLSIDKARGKGGVNQNAWEGGRVQEANASKPGKRADT